jgi:methyl-accepting chemotaxis protein
MAATAARIAEADLPALAAATAAMASGDLTQSYSAQAQPVRHRSGDELGNLAQAFNAMIERLQATGVSFGEMAGQLRSLVGEVATSAASVGAASGPLENAASQTGQATGQIAGTMQQVAKGISQQAEDVGKTAPPQRK